MAQIDEERLVVVGDDRMVIVPGLVVCFWAGSGSVLQASFVDGVEARYESLPRCYCVIVGDKTALALLAHRTDLG